MSYLGNVVANSAVIATMNGDTQINGTFTLNGDVIPLNVSSNQLGYDSNPWLNTYSNFGFFGSASLVSSGPIVSITQSGDASNPALVLDGMGFAGGPSNIGSGACMFLNYNSPGTNVQWVMGDSAFIGNGAGMIRFISGGGTSSGYTAIDCMSGDGNVQLDVPFASAPIPVSDGAVNCGSSTNRWGAVYAVNPVIQTSSAECKDKISHSNVGLDFINSLQPKCWNWKEIPNADIDTTAIHHGFIYEDVLEVMPENFGGVHPANGKGVDGLSYSSFIAPLTKAIQELSAKVTRLERILEGQGLL